MFSGNGNSKVWPTDQQTNGRTDRQTWVGARDACASKKWYWEDFDVFDDDDDDARKLKTKRDDRNILSRKDQEKWDYWKGVEWGLAEYEDENDDDENDHDDEENDDDESEDQDENDNDSENHGGVGQ